MQARIPDQITTSSAFQLTGKIAQISHIPAISQQASVIFAILESNETQITFSSAAFLEKAFFHLVQIQQGQLHPEVSERPEHKRLHSC